MIFISIVKFKLMAVRLVTQEKESVTSHVSQVLKEGILWWIVKVQQAKW